MWVVPVTDRTLSDVKNKTDKAFLLHTDWNRIEENIAYLVEYLKTFCLTTILTSKLDWAISNIPYTEEQNRILANIQKIVNNAEYYNVAIEDMQFLNYSGVNKIESGLLGTKQKLDNYTQSYKCFGTAYIGQESLL